MSRRYIFVLCTISLVSIIGCSPPPPSPPLTVAYTLSGTYPLLGETALSINCKNVGEGITITPANCSENGELRVFVESQRQICDLDLYTGRTYYRWARDKTKTATLRPDQVAAVIQAPDDWQHIDFRFEYDFLGETDATPRELQIYLDRAEVTIYASAEVINSLGL